MRSEASHSVGLDECRRSTVCPHIILVDVGWFFITCVFSCVLPHIPKHHRLKVPRGSPRCLGRCRRLRHRAHSQGWGGGARCGAATAAGPSSLGARQEISTWFWGWSECRKIRNGGDFTDLVFWVIFKCQNPTEILLRWAMGIDTLL